jgi:PAS domain S-box-containing protein
MVLLTSIAGWLAIRAWRRRNAVTEALQESETRFRQVTEALDEWVWEVDADGVYRYVSPAVERILGYRPAELVGKKTFYDLFTPDTREALKEQAFRIFADREPITRMPNANLHKDGQVVHLETTGSPMEDAQGRLLGYRGADTDVTARTHAEKALRDAEAHQRALLGALPDLLFLVTREGRFLSYHAPASRHLAVPVGEFLNRTLAEVMPPQVAAAAMACLEKTLATGEVQSLDYCLELAAGPRYFEGKFAKAAEGTVLILARDITERRLEQEAQRRLEVELHHAQKLESLGSLAGGVAHDMNNVLAAILGLASTQQGRNPGNAPLLKALATIERAAERGSVLVRSLTEFARKDLEAPKLMDLNELVRQEMELLGRTTFNKVELSATLEEPLPLIMGEASALASALMNLCVNAMDAMPDGGTLQLRTCKGAGSQVELTVTDSGQGMTAEVLARAMEPFYTTKPLGKGTGLGLSLVYGTLKAHGGTMDIQSQPGRGTQVCLRFPGLARETLPEPVAALPAAGRRGMRVLLVDDDELLLDAVPPMLKHLGHEVVAVADGLEALQQCQLGQPFDVMILDNNMPGLSGMETLAQLRRFLPVLPVIIATGRVDATVRTAVSQDANLYLLPKPFGLQSLRAALADVPELVLP